MGRVFFFIIEILIVTSLVMLLLDWLSQQGTHNTQLKNLKSVLDEMNDDCSPRRDKHNHNE